MIFLALAALIAVCVTLGALITWAVRARFDPFDAFLLALAGYVGYLIIAGLVVDATPLGLSRAGLTCAVMVPAAASAAYLVLVGRGRGLVGQTRSRLADCLGRARTERKRTIATSIIVVVTAAIMVVSLAFARQTEEQALTPHGVAVYLDPDGSTVSIHNPTPATQRLEVSGERTDDGGRSDRRGSTATITVVLRPGETWRTSTRARDGRFDLAVVQGDGRRLSLALEGLEPDVSNGVKGTGW